MLDQVEHPQFTTKELVEALKSMKAGKAPGPDDIRPEFLLHAGDAATEWLCHTKHLVIRDHDWVHLPTGYSVLFEYR